MQRPRRARHAERLLRRVRSQPGGCVPAWRAPSASRLGGQSSGQLASVPAVPAVEHALRKVPGVLDAQVNFLTGAAEVGTAGSRTGGHAAPAACQGTCRPASRRRRGHQHAAGHACKPLLGSARPIGRARSELSSLSEPRCRPLATLLPNTHPDPCLPSSRAGTVRPRCYRPTPPAGGRAGGGLRGGAARGAAPGCDARRCAQHAWCWLAVPCRAAALRAAEGCGCGMFGPRCKRQHSAGRRAGDGAPAPPVMSALESGTSQVQTLWKPAAPRRCVAGGTAPSPRCSRCLSS